MIVETLVTALLIAVGCNLLMFVFWLRERAWRELAQAQRDRAVQQARNGLAAMNAAIKGNETLL